MKFSDIATDARDDLGRLVNAGRVVQFRRKAAVFGSDGENVFGAVEKIDAAIREFLHVLRLEDDVPAVKPLVAEPFFDLGGIVGDAGGEPHVRHGELVARVVDGEARRDLGIDALEIGQERLVQLLKHASFDLALQEGRRGYDDVVSGAARKQPRLQDFVGIIGVVDDLDPGFLGEFLERLLVDIIGPVGDVQRRFRPRCGRGEKRREAKAKQERVLRETA